MAVGDLAVRPDQEARWDQIHTPGFVTVESRISSIGKAEPGASRPCREPCARFRPLHRRESVNGFLLEGIAQRSMLGSS